MASGFPIDAMARAAGLDPARLTPWQREVLEFQGYDRMAAGMQRLSASMVRMDSVFAGLADELRRLADALGARHARIRRMHHLYRLRRKGKW